MRRLAKGGDKGLGEREKMEMGVGVGMRGLERTFGGIARLVVLGKQLEVPILKPRDPPLVLLVVLALGPLHDADDELLELLDGRLVFRLLLVVGLLRRVWHVGWQRQRHFLKIGDGVSRFGDGRWGGFVAAAGAGVGERRTGDEEKGRKWVQIGHFIHGWLAM